MPDPRDHRPPAPDPRDHARGVRDRRVDHPPGDPIAARRARIATGLRIVKRIGYAALAVSILGFVAAAATGFPVALVALSVAGLIAACVILPLPIILAYGVRAAEREERGRR